MLHTDRVIARLTTKPHLPSRPDDAAAAGATHLALTLLENYQQHLVRCNASSERPVTPSPTAS